MGDGTLGTLWRDKSPRQDFDSSLQTVQLKLSLQQKPLWVLESSIIQQSISQTEG